MDKREQKKYESIFQDALGWLIREHAFFGHIMANTVRVLDEKIPFLSLSMTPEGKISIHYNLEDVKTAIEVRNMTLVNLTACIQHTVYHMINEHFLRRKEEGYGAWVVLPEGPARLFDICCDLAINQYIQNLPEGTLDLKSFEGELPPEENAEYYYKVLYTRAKENGQMIQGKGMDLGDAIGVLFSRDGNKDEEMNDMSAMLPLDAKGKDMRSADMIDDHDWKGFDSIPSDMIRASVKDLVKKAYHASKYGGHGRGDMPAGIERMVEESLKPPYDFRPYLKRFVDGELFSHYEDTRKKPNRRFGYKFPGHQSVMKAKIGVLADTSGSMGDDEIAQLAKNIENINEYAQVILFEVDAAINDVNEYERKKFKNMMKGGGGTGFDDVFKVMDDYKHNKDLLDALEPEKRERAHMLVQDIKALIIMTDGEVTVRDKPPKLPVLWALTEKAQGPPAKWGDVIYLDNDPDKHKGPPRERRSI